MLITTLPSFPSPTNGGGAGGEINRYDGCSQWWTEISDGGSSFDGSMRMRLDEKGITFIEGGMITIRVLDESHYESGATNKP